MQDLTKITTPFGLLDEETKAALKAHGGPYEVWTNKWVYTPSANWFSEYAYRVKPIELTKPSINWDHVAPQYNWLARWEGGRSYLYTNRPKKDDRYWRCVNNMAISSKSFASYTPGTCDWKDSLVMRPGYEGD